MNTAKKALEYAISKIGCRYSQNARWEDNVFDCSSLIYRAYRDAGYTFVSGSTSNTEVDDLAFDLIWPRTRSSIGKQFTSVAALRNGDYKAQPGDVIYICTNSATTRSNKITHVVMVENTKTIVHARGTAYGVRRDSIDLYGNKVVAVTRYHVETNASGPINPVKTGPAGVTYAYCLGDRVNVRSSAPNGTVIGQVNLHHPLVTGEVKGDWTRVATLRTASTPLTGWMYNKYIGLN